MLIRLLMVLGILGTLAACAQPPQDTAYWSDIAKVVRTTQKGH